jgi:O-antigen/teichoic acid export membrane protein
LRSTLLRGGTLVVASTFVWHASNFGFNAAAAHLLGPVKYGNLTSAVALLALANPVLTSLQTVASRLTTTLVGRGETSRVRGLLLFYGVRVGFAALFATGLIVLASRAIGRFLREPSPWPIAIAGIVTLLSVVTHLQRGVLQGTKSFGRYSVSTVIEATTKIVFAILLVELVSRSVEAALVAVGIASVAGALANALLLRYLPRSSDRARPVSHPYRYSLLTLGTLILLSLLFAVDILAAKRYLSPHDAGLYAAVSLSGKVIFFASSAVSLFLFPLFSSRQDEGLDSRRLFAGACGVVAVGASLVIALYAVAPGLVVTPLFGAKYAAAKPFLPYIGLAFALYAIAYLGSLFLLSHGRSTGTVVLASCVLGQLFGLYIFHSDIKRIVGVQIAIFAVAALGIAGLCARRAERLAPVDALAAEIA